MIYNFIQSYRFIIIKDMNVCCIIIRLITKKKNTLSYQGEKEKERKKERHILNQTILQTGFVTIFFIFHNIHKSFVTI